MKNPEITTTIGGYILEFENNLSVKVNRLDVHSDGRVTGDLQFIDNSNKLPIILLPSTQFNFSSETTRSKYAKQLTQKYPDKLINWTEIFDYLGYKVQEMARAGEPVQEIWSDDEITPIEYLLKPFILKGMANCIFGEKGVSKSTLSYILGTCLVLPEDHILGLETGGKPIKSLVLDWETNEQTFKYYLSRLKRGMNLGTFPLFYRRCRLPLAEELEAIERHIQETEVEVLIIDSLAAAAGGEQGELKGSQAALQFNSALRKLNKTSWIIAQTSKALDSPKKTIYGSVIFTYYSRNIFELCMSEEEQSNVIHLAIFHRHCNLDKRSPPMGFRMIFDDANYGITIERESVSVAEFAQKMSTKMRIVDALKRGAMTQKELASLLNVSLPNVGMAVKRLKDENKVVKVDDKWGLSVL